MILKILVVDDHALVREGLRQVLKGLDAAVEVIDAPDCARAFALAARHSDLDLVLLDYRLPDMNGLDALAVFGKEHPELPILMLSGSVNPQIVHQVLARGAAGFLSKTGVSEELLAAVRLVLAGEIYVPAQFLTPRDPAALPTANPGGGAHSLTPRQIEVLYLLLDGHSNKDIGRALQLSDETAKNHVSAIYRVFGVQTRVQAVLAAARLGYTKASPSD